jgi:hypothetical protein
MIYLSMVISYINQRVFMHYYELLIYYLPNFLGMYFSQCLFGRLVSDPLKRVSCRA